jgi:hypothetical protein
MNIFPLSDLFLSKFRYIKKHSLFLVYFERTILLLGGINVTKKRKILFCHPDSHC